MQYFSTCPIFLVLVMQIYITDTATLYPKLVAHTPTAIRKFHLLPMPFVASPSPADSGQIQKSPCHRSPARLPDDVPYRLICHTSGHPRRPGELLRRHHPRVSSWPWWTLRRRVCRLRDTTVAMENNAQHPHLLRIGHCSSSTLARCLNPRSTNCVARLI